MLGDIFNSHSSGIGVGDEGHGWYWLLMGRNQWWCQSPLKHSIASGEKKKKNDLAPNSHSSILAWRIPRTEGPGGLPSMGSCRVGHDWSDLAAAAAAAAAAMKKINELCSIQCYPRYYQKDRRNYNCCHCLFVSKLDCYSWWRGSGTESSKHDLEENSESHSGGIF